MPDARIARGSWIVVLGIALLAIIGLTAVSRPGEQAVPAGATTSFLETFNGAPASPQPFVSANWDVVVHSRDRDTWDALEDMDSQHGPGCEAPPAPRTPSTGAMRWRRSAAAIT